MQSIEKRVVVLGTGGTIAGVSKDPSNTTAYVAGVLGVESLVAAVPALAGLPIEIEQVGQMDSKDMSFALWRKLAARVSHHLADAEVAGIVVTHGTDTLEETAYFLQRLLAPAKPVVLTAAMRPATALLADGPQNLLDAVTVAGLAAARGALVVMAGQVYAARGVRKGSTWRLDAFDAGDHGPIALLRDGHVRSLRDWPDGGAVGIDALPREDDAWPWVEIVFNTAGASGAAVRALVKAGVRGIVAAGTGNGTLHIDMEDALKQAAADGVAVARCSRCASGAVTDSGESPFPVHANGDLTAVQMRVELMLELALQDATTGSTSAA